jgi:microcystin-dependent protein
LHAANSIAELNGIQDASVNLHKSSHPSLATANLPAHAHSFAPLGSTNDANSVSPAGKVAASKARTTLYTDPVNVVAQATGTTGSNAPFNIMQPYVTLKCFISMFGVFPSRD